MKKLYAVAAIVLLSACVNEQLEEKSLPDGTSEIKAIATKADGNQYVNPADSLFGKSIIQSDFDNLMISRIITKDGVYVLSIKKEAASFLGVPDEMYDFYSEYVNSLNANQ